MLHLKSNNTHLKGHGILIFPMIYKISLERCKFIESNLTTWKPTLEEANSWFSLDFAFCPNDCWKRNGQLLVSVTNIFLWKMKSIHNMTSHWDSPGETDKIVGSYINIRHGKDHVFLCKLFMIHMTLWYYDTDTRSVLKFPSTSCSICVWHSNSNKLT